jgi:3-methyladenine DNA glycosylase AlkD
MDINEAMHLLKEVGNEKTKKTLMKHGVREPFYNVKVADLKKIQKKAKKDYKLSMELYATGNSDAMYLAGMIAEPEKMTKKDLDDWAKKAYWYYLSEFTVPITASQSPYCLELARKWIESGEEMIAAAAWASFSNYISITENDKIDLKEIKALMARAGKEVHSSPNRVRYTMNGFIIAVGSYIPDLQEEALAIAKEVGKVDVDMGGTSCKVPLAADYIKKIEEKGRLGKKRKPGF